MNPVILIGAASMSLLGLGLKRLRRNDSLENPAPIGVFGSAEQVVETVSDCLIKFSGTTWLWTVHEKDPVRGIVTAECLCTERDERPIKLAARFDSHKHTLELKFEVQALLGRKPINKLLERTYKAVLFGLEELFEEYVGNPANSLEDLLSVLQSAREASLPLSNEQLGDLMREIEKRALKTLSVGESREYDQLYVERVAETRVKIGRTRGRASESGDAGKKDDAVKKK